MKNPVLVLLGGAMASLLGLPSAESRHAQNPRPAGGELRERDESRQSFRLAAGALVEVSSIRGAVEVSTADGGDAEVHVVRSAQSRADLEQFKVVVEQGPRGLVVRGEQARRDDGGLAPEVRHRVVLRLPRDVSLAVQSVSGDVRIGDLSGGLTVGSVSGSVGAGAVGGRVQVSGVSGGVSVGSAGQGAEVSSVSGGVSIGQAVGSLEVMGVSGELRAVVNRLGEGGVRVASVSGRVELRFGGELNAELSADNVSGGLSLDVPGVAVSSRPNASAVRAVIGRGGPAISINGVSQGVRLAPAS